MFIVNILLLKKNKITLIATQNGGDVQLPTAVVSLCMPASIFQ
jgi:hypothetical protein